MPRYIDADKLCEALKSMASVQPTFKQSTILGVVSSIENFPTADVVPRAEVEELRENNSLLAAAVQAWQKYYENLAREIFEEIEKIYGEYGFFNGYRIAELKKKYTEEKKDEKN